MNNFCEIIDGKITSGPQLLPERWVDKSGNQLSSFSSLAYRGQYGLNVLECHGWYPVEMINDIAFDPEIHENITRELVFDAAAKKVYSNQKYIDNTAETKLAEWKMEISQLKMPREAEDLWDVVLPMLEIISTLTSKTLPVPDDFVRESYEAKKNVRLTNPDAVEALEAVEDRTTWQGIKEYFTTYKGLW